MKRASHRNLRRDEFVKSVRPDPTSNEELVLLQGYIGDSTIDGHVRIYFDARLSDFIELPEQDILHANPIEAAEDPLGGSRLWVRKTTVFTTGDPSHANRIKSSFLEGDLIKAFGNQGGTRALGRIGGVPSAFLVGGCAFTERFGDCAPTGANDPFCNVLDPTTGITIGPSRFNATCPQNPCFPSRPIGCATGRPFELCITANNNTCDLVLAREANIPNPQPGTQTYTGRFNPYGQ